MYWQGIINRKKLVAKTRKHLEEKIKKQTKELITLEDKVKHWYKAKLKEEKEKYLEQEKLAKNIIKKKEIQKKELHILKLQQEVIPKAVELAYQEILQKYGGEQGHLATTELIRRLNKKIS